MSTKNADPVKKYDIFQHGHSVLYVTLVSRVQIHQDILIYLIKEHHKRSHGRGIQNTWLVHLLGADEVLSCLCSDFAIFHWFIYTSGLPQDVRIFTQLKSMQEKWTMLLKNNPSLVLVLVYICFNYPSAVVVKCFVPKWV